MAKIKLDFTGVQDGFKTIDKPGTYPVKITKVEPKKSSQGKPYLNWELQVISGEFKGSKLWYVTSLQKQALFNLRNFLQSAGLEIPKSVVSIELDTVVGRQLNAKVIMEEYDGEMKPKVKEVSSISTTSNDGLDDISTGTELESIGLSDIDLEGLDL